MGADREKLVLVHEALEKLAIEDPARVEEVKLHCFVGLTHAEVAEVLQFSETTKRRPDLATRIYRQLAGAHGLDDTERWQHALFFALSPQERCHFSLKTARSALSLRRSAKRK